MIKKINDAQREENLRYTKLTRIFQKLGINAKFSKTMCA